MEVEFVVFDDEARQRLKLVQDARLQLYYARTADNFGVIDPDVSPPDQQ